MTDEKKVVALISLGCAKNTVDSELMLNSLHENGFEITDRPENAHVAVINTCAFINDAMMESIQLIIETAKLKDKKLEKIIVAGCLAERYKQKVFKELPEVDAIVDTSNYMNVTKAVKKVYADTKVSYLSKVTDIDYLNNQRVYDESVPYSYVKISEGCSNNCSFCIIPQIRGKFQSRDMENIVNECENMIVSGKKELILIAQDTANYGIDIYGEQKLHKLVGLISKISDDVRIRIMYMYPEYLNDNLLNVFTYDNVVNYLDIPIQHVNNRLRKLMNRKKDIEFIKEKIYKVKKRYPDMFIRTTLITGFPGETEDEYKSMLEFAKGDLVDFSGVFKYSPQEGTKAALMEDQIDDEIKERRYREISKAVGDRMLTKAKNSIGKKVNVLCDGVADDGIFYKGRMYSQAPEIDTCVYFTAEAKVDTGEFVNVKVLNNHDIDLIGEVVYEYSE